MPAKIRNSMLSHNNYFLMPGYCQNEFEYISDVIALSNSKYFFFLELNIEDEVKIDFKKFFFGTINETFYHFRLSGKPIYTNVKIFDKSNVNNCFIFSTRDSLRKVFTPPFISIEYISILPIFLKENRNCKFSILLINYLRNQFNPIIGYNDLLANIKKINPEIFLKNPL